MITVFLAFFLLASAISANKIILFAMNPTLLTAIRMTVSGVLLFLYIYFSSHQKVSIKKIKENFIVLLLVSLSTTCIPSLLKAYSLKTMTSSKASFFGTLDPFVTAVYAYFLFDEKLNLKKTIGILFGFAGALILLFSTSSVEEHLMAFSIISYPEIAAFLAVAISRLGWIFIQKILRENIFSGAQINTVTMIFGGAISFILSILFMQTSVGSLENAQFSILKKYPFISFSPESQLLFFLAYTIIIGNLVGYNLYASVLKKYSSTFISLAGFSVPLAVYFYGWLFLSEPLSLNFIIACFVTFVGLLIFYKAEK